MPYYDFTEMPVWKSADEIIHDIYKLTESLPRKEDYARCSQMRDAAVSIAGNIAEGFGRGHIKDKVNFYFYSRGSCFEVRSHLYSSRTAGYYTTDQIDPIDKKCMKVIEEINRIIKGLRLKP